MSAARRDAFSRPVFDQTIRIQSNHAQRLLDRGFLLVVRALYGIDVVLRIIGDDEGMDQVEEIVGKLIAELAEELLAEHARLAQLRETSECRRARDTFWDVRVPEMTALGDSSCAPVRPASVALRRHHRKCSMPASHHSHKWLDGVSDAHAYALRQLRDLRPLRPLRPYACAYAYR